MAYQMAATAVTLNDLEGHSPVWGLSFLPIVDFSEVVLLTWLLFSSRYLFQYFSCFFCILTAISMMCSGYLGADNACRMWICAVRDHCEHWEPSELPWLGWRVHGLQLRTLVSSLSQVLWSRLYYKNSKPNRGCWHLQSKHIHLIKK